jgi:hypothetical protein
MADRVGNCAIRTVDCRHPGLAAELQRTSSADTPRIIRGAPAMTSAGDDTLYSA